MKYLRRSLSQYSKDKKKDQKRKESLVFGPCGNICLCQAITVNTGELPFLLTDQKPVGRANTLQINAFTYM